MIIEMKIFKEENGEYIEGKSDIDNSLIEIAGFDILIDESKAFIETMLDEYKRKFCDDPT